MQSSFEFEPPNLWRKAGAFDKAEVKLSPPRSDLISLHVIRSGRTNTSHDRQQPGNGNTATLLLRAIYRGRLGLLD